MIHSKNDYKYYLNSDRLARGIPKKISLREWIISWFIPNYVWSFQKALRKLEYIKNCKKGLFSDIRYLFVLRKYRKLSYKCGFSIPPNVFGPGLSIAHYGTIIINGNARIGKNCRLHANVNIGTQAGFADQAPVLGDNCYIGPGVKMYGKIVFSDNIIFGANSVVNKSIPGNNIAIAGIPARKISDIDILNVLIPATDIIDKGYESSFEALLRIGGSLQVEEIKKFVHKI